MYWPSIELFGRFSRKKYHIFLASWKYIFALIETSDYRGFLGVVHWPVPCMCVFKKKTDFKYFLLKLLTCSWPLLRCMANQTLPDIVIYIWRKPDIAQYCTHFLKYRRALIKPVRAPQPTTTMHKSWRSISKMQIKLLDVSVLCFFL